MKKKSASDRRKFLAAASKLSAMMTVLGLTGMSLSGKSLSAGVTNDQKAMLELLQYAIQTGNMEDAIRKYGQQAGLNDKQLKALRSLTNSDLACLKMIQGKLEPAGGHLALEWCY